MNAVTDRNGSLPPGPSGPALWTTLEYMMRPQAMTAKNRARFGDAFRIETMRHRGLVVCTPALAREVMALDPRTIRRQSHLDGVLGPRSLFQTFGEDHRRQRTTVNPCFRSVKLQNFLGSMRETARRHFAAWHRRVSSDAPVVMLDVTQALSMDIMLLAIFGQDVDLERARTLSLRVLHAASPLFIFIPQTQSSWFPPWRHFVRERQAFDAFVVAAIAGARTTATRDSILPMLLDARDEAGNGMPDEEIVDQVVTLLMAGFETTAISLAWGAYWLARTPGVVDRLRDELAHLDGDTAALARAPYLGAVCDETLRMRPAAPEFTRVAVEPITVGGWKVQPGEFVIVSVQNILADPLTFPEPERFRPERFLERTFSPSEFLPYGGGNRRCLGAVFADFELRVVLATLASEWNLAPADAREERSVRRNVTVGPARGVRLRVSPRAPSPPTDCDHRSDPSSRPAGSLRRLGADKTS